MAGKTRKQIAAEVYADAGKMELSEEEAYRMLQSRLKSAGFALDKNVEEMKKEYYIGDDKTSKEKEKRLKGKAEMRYGGMANGKKHNYAAGGNVSDNAGLRALKVASPEAYKKITGK